MKIKTIIIVNEISVNTDMRRIISNDFPELSLIGNATSVQSGIELIIASKPDLIILDTQMGDGSGFNLLDRLPMIDFQIIFVTANDEFAINAFKFSEQDYLLKPIDPDSLNLMISKIVKEFRKTNIFSSVNHLLTNLRRGVFDKLVIPTTDSIDFVDLENIIRIESDSNYSIFIMQENKKQISTKTLGNYENIMPSHFIRVHRSHVINIHYIKKIKSNNTLIMTNGDTLSISRRRKETLNFAIKKYYK